MAHFTCRLIAQHRDQHGTLRSATDHGLPFSFYFEVALDLEEEQKQKYVFLLFYSKHSPKIHWFIWYGTDRRIDGSLHCLITHLPYSAVDMITRGSIYKISYDLS